MENRVLFAIQGLNRWKKEATFTAIHFHVLVGGQVPFRQVDRALQSLRRKGLIKYDRKTGWAALGASGPKTGEGSR